LAISSKSEYTVLNYVSIFETPWTHGVSNSIAELNTQNMSDENYKTE